MNEKETKEQIKEEYIEEERDYNKMKKEAGDFAKWLVKHEQAFSQEILDCNDGLAVYFDIETRDDKIITIFFKDNGYVGMEVKENE